MIYTTTKIITRYAESDQMGVIHHSNYLIYCEQARVDWLDNLGFSYGEMEEKGVMLPLYKADLEYRKPLKAMSKITVKTYLRELPSTRVVLGYEITNDSGILCAVAHTTLVFTNRSSFKPMRPPKNFMEAVKKRVD